MAAAHEKYIYIAFSWRISVFFFKYVLETFKKKVQYVLPPKNQE